MVEHLSVRRVLLRYVNSSWQIKCSLLLCSALHVIPTIPSQCLCCSWTHWLTCIHFGTTMCCRSSGSHFTGCPHYRLCVLLPQEQGGRHFCELHIQNIYSHYCIVKFVYEYTYVCTLMKCHTKFHKVQLSDMLCLFSDIFTVCGECNDSGWWNRRGISSSSHGFMGVGATGHYCPGTTRRRELWWSLSRLGQVWSWCTINQIPLWNNWRLARGS